MENYFDKQFELRYFEMNKFGEASSTTILTLLEETAADHCFSINHSLYDLQEQNIGWVLLSGVMKIDRYPRYKEKITIRTWLSSYSTVKGFRENIIYDELGNILGRARGQWLFFDILSRKPIRIFDEIKHKWSFCSDECIRYDIKKKIETIDSGKYIKEFHINHFDVDSYLHVNNIRYLQWMMESIPAEVFDNYYLHLIDGRFISEAQYGEAVISITERDIYDNSFAHAIKTKNNNTFCATARTLWKERGGPDSLKLH